MRVRGILPSRRVWTSALLAGAFPVLVAVHAPLSLFAANIDEVLPQETIRSFALLGLVSLLSAILLSALLRSPAKGALASGIGWIAFLSYGHVYNALKAFTVAGVLLGRHRYLAPLFILVVLAAWIWIARRPRLAARNLVPLSLAALILVLLSAIPVVGYLRPGAGLEPTAPVGLPTDGASPTGGPARADLPDIYYIIVDAHGRADTLKALYGYDNSSFIEALRSQGFYVAERSLSNYSQTALSLGSSLNMAYLDELAVELGPSSQDRRPARELVTRNAVMALARDLGYEIVTTETALLWEVFEGADEVLRPDYATLRSEFALLGALGLSPFEGMLVETTLARVWYDQLVRGQQTAQSVTPFEYHKHRERILFQFEQLRRLPEREGPQFVLVHIMAPHAPFVFGALGEEVPNARAFTLLDGGCCAWEEYRERLPAQVEFIDRMLTETVRAILSASPRPPIIVIQGDHGPAGYVYGEWRPELGRLDRMAILNAYYLPVGCRHVLYPEITPVNTFRVVFGACLGLPLDLLPDASYFSDYERPYEFVQVTPRNLE